MHSAVDLPVAAMAWRSTPTAWSYWPWSMSAWPWACRLAASEDPPLASEPEPLDADPPPVLGVEVVPDEEEPVDGAGVLVAGAEGGVDRVFGARFCFCFWVAAEVPPARSAVPPEPPLSTMATT